MGRGQLGGRRLVFKFQQIAPPKSLCLAAIKQFCIEKIGSCK